MDQNVGGNALKLVGEAFVPGAAQLIAGNVTSGLLHTALGITAGAALVGTGIAPLLGTLVVLGVKLNSYSMAVTGDDLVSTIKDRTQTAPDRVPGQPAAAV